VGASVFNVSVPGGDPNLKGPAKHKLDDRRPRVDLAFDSAQDDPETKKLNTQAKVLNDEYWHLDMGELVIKDRHQKDSHAPRVNRAIHEVQTERKIILRKLSEVSNKIEDLAEKCR
jgi:hypothetical protein